MNKRDELVGRLQQLLDAGDAIGGLSRITISADEARDILSSLREGFTASGDAPSLAAASLSREDERDQIIETCAQVAEDHAYHWPCHQCTGTSDIEQCGEVISRAIRSLKQSHPDSAHLESEHGSSPIGCADVVRASYDINTDVMYVAIADKPAVAKHGEFGLVLRYAPETEEPIGVTVIDFADMWGNRQQLRIPMVDVIAKHLKLPRQTVYEALRDNYHEPRGLSAAEEPCSEGVNPKSPTGEA